MRERQIILLTAVLNIIVASIKLITGIIFNFSTLISDSIQSFIDFFTDIASLVANKIGKRRANKIYPFGYGQVYYVSNLLTGLLLFLVGIFVLYQVFTSKTEFVPNITVLFILVLALMIKMIVIVLLQKYGENTKSELLIESFKESRADFISTCVVIVVLIISYFEKYIPEFINIDKIGSIGMAFYIFYTSIKMIIANTRGVLINDEGNEEIKESIIKELEQFKDLKISNIRIIKLSYYYSVFLQIDVKNSIQITKFLKIEKKIKNHLKSKNKQIKYIDIEPL